MGFFRLKYFIAINMFVGFFSWLLLNILRPEDRLFAVIICFAVPNGIYLYYTMSKLQIINIDFEDFIDKRNKKLRQTLKKNKSKKIKNVYLTGAGELIGYKGHIPNWNKRYYIIWTKKHGIIVCPKSRVVKTQMFDEQILQLEGGAIYQHKTGINPLLYEGITKQEFNEGDNLRGVEMFEDMESSTLNTFKGALNKLTTSNIFAVLKDMERKKTPK